MFLPYALELLTHSFSLFLLSFDCSLFLLLDMLNFNFVKLHELLNCACKLHYVLAALLEAVKTHKESV